MEKKEFYDTLNTTLIPRFLKEIEESGIDAANAESIPLFLGEAIKKCNFEHSCATVFKAYPLEGS